MKGFYQVTTAIKDQLYKDIFVNTVSSGDIFEIDLNKQTIFPLSHIIVNNATYNGNTWLFNISVLCMDVVDFSKTEQTDQFLTNDNEQDVLHTQLMVINRLLEVLRRGALMDEGYELNGTPNCEPFVDRFENKIAGWTVTFDVMVANEMTSCSNEC
jgi:alpha-amylase/alpha-mannosidase (GH57 family)